MRCPNCGTKYKGKKCPECGRHTDPSLEAKQHARINFYQSVINIIRSI